MIRPRIVLWFSVSLFLLACDDHGKGPPAGSPCADRQQVSLPDCSGGADGFSDESCVPLDDALTNNRATSSDSRAPSITAPTEMQAVPAATPFTFRWSAPTASRPQRAMTVGEELRRWFTLLPEAEAHCAPFSGRAYELRFRVGSNVVFRRQQSTLSWTPTAAEWTSLTNAIGAQTAELTIYTALYTSNQIGTGNGPFVQTAARRFTVAR